MKRENADCGHAPHPRRQCRNTLTTLPFCGLGGQRAIQGAVAARVLSPVPTEGRTAQAGGVDAPARS